MRLTILLFILFLLFESCKETALTKEETSKVLSNPALFHEASEKLTDIVVHDIFSPPVASRVYVYPNIAAYEVLASSRTKYRSLSTQLNGFEKLQIPEISEEIDYSLAAVVAFLMTARELVFSQREIDVYWYKFSNNLDSLGISKRVLDSSYKYGQEISKQVIKWSEQDNYAKTRSAPRYSISNEPGRWRPTPPAFMEGIEPHWREMRTMILLDLKIYQPKGTVDFNIDPISPFYKQVLETKNAVDNATKEQKAIAAFWDCNPYVMNVTGHTMYASKKITPGGHWMGICATATRKEELDLIETVEIHTKTAIAIYDAFISCWDEKYRSNLIRPETVINEHIDPDWKPILQTPPFPEYTSGHSVISTAAAVVLTDYFGENFNYTDEVELKYGLPSREFKSFKQAAEEAAISRLYGGIHYLPAIEDGVVQGRKIGEEVLVSVVTVE